MTQDLLHILALCLENQRALIREVLTLGAKASPDQQSEVMTALEKTALGVEWPNLNTEQPEPESDPVEVKSVEIGGLEFEFPTDSPLSKLK